MIFSGSGSATPKPTPWNSDGRKPARVWGPPGGALPKATKDGRFWFSVPSP
jgi:hypothetical protein